MVGDYISREAAMTVLDWDCASQDALNAIKAIPAADAVEVVRCRDCIHRPFGTGANHDMKFPDEECPCQCSDDLWYSWMPPDDWYCPHGERKDGGQDDDC